MEKLRVTNSTRSKVLADRADIADTPASRNRGLLKHTKLDPGEGLWSLPVRLSAVAISLVQVSNGPEPLSGESIL